MGEIWQNRLVAIDWNFRKLDQSVMAYLSVPSVFLGNLARCIFYEILFYILSFSIVIVGLKVVSCLEAANMEITAN